MILAMLFIYFISDVLKMQAAGAAQGDLSPDAALLQKLFDDKSVAEKAHIMTSACMLSQRASLRQRVPDFLQRQPW
jgi:hypothetical protein